MAGPSSTWAKIRFWRARWSASAIKGLQDQHVIGDIKHYALNDQESGRNAVNVNIDKRAARESDLLAFEIGVHGLQRAARSCVLTIAWTATMPARTSICSPTF